MPGIPLSVQVTIFLALFALVVGVAAMLSKKLDKISDEAFERQDRLLTKEAFREYKSDIGREQGELWRQVNEQRDKIATFAAEFARVNVTLSSMATMLGEIKGEVAAVHRYLDKHSGGKDDE